MVFGAPSALAAFHGVGVTKGCTSPVKIGDPYTCAVQILNVVDTGHDTLEITGLSDTVNAASGPVATGDILPTVGLIFSDPSVMCSGGSGAGTAASPYLGAQDCLLPFGTNIQTTSFSHYTVQSGDFNIPTATSLAANANAGDTNVKLTQTSGLSVGDTFTIDPSGAHPETRVATFVGTNGAAGTGVSFATPLSFAHTSPVRVNLFIHHLSDTATLDWNNTCVSDPDNDCTTNPEENTAGASATVLKLASSTTTQIHDAAHAPVTVVAAGSTVHDFVTVGGQPSSPPPSGNVTIDWFTNNQCTGNPVATSGNEVLDANGQVDATNFPQGPLPAGLYGFVAHYKGDATYLSSDGACEPLRVVDANISITPNGVNHVGQTHTFTAHVNVNDGTGFVNAPDGTSISFTVDGGPGSFTSPNPCTTSGATGSCTISLQSFVTGVTTVSAHTSVSVAGVVLARSTDGTGSNSGPAVKTWVDARIHITPSATNRVGQPHTFTVTLEKDLGNGAGFVPAAGEHVDVTLADAKGAGHTAPTGTCTNTGANTDANGQCTITFTSPTTGTVTGHATSTLSVGGSSPFTVQTDGVAPNGPDAVKTFVNAKIAITPSATNPVGAPHTFTVTLLKDLGDGNGFVAAAGEHVDVTLTDSNGATHTAPTGSCTTAGPNTDANGQCTITFSSPTGGTVTGHATSTLTVGGVPITVATDGVAPNSGDVVKTFVDANIQITPNGVNRVGQTHTFTAHVNVDDGSGAGFVPAPDGTTISFTIDSGPGSFTTPNPCTTSGGSGSCQITLTSATPGVTVVSAHTDVTVGGLSLHRDTDGLAGDSEPATKRWVDARIHITPSATNEVGQNHTFTVLVEKNLGDGNGWVAAASEPVTVTLTNGNGGAFAISTNTCTAGTNASGRCAVTFTSPTTGTVVGHASSTLADLGTQAPVAVETDGQGQNGSDAVKTFVDAYITISPPSAVNPINTTHTYTAHVFVNDGSGAGYVDAPSGTVVSFSFVGAHVGSFVAGASCTVAGGGTCTVDTTSAKPGNDTMSATTTISVGGVALTRTTGQPAAGHANSDNAAKNWVGAKIAITPNATNEVGAPHTFTVTLSEDMGDGYQPAPNEHVDVTLTDAKGAAHTAPTGTCLTAGANTDANGRCTVTFTSPTAGTVTGHATSTLSVGGRQVTVSTDGAGDNSGDAVKTFVDANITIAPNATNEVGASHTFTVTVKKNAGDGNGFVGAQGVNVTTAISNASGATATVKGGSCTTTTTDANGQCTLVISSPTAGTTTANASASLTVGGVTLTRDTDPATANVGAGPNGSGPAVKTWVDANIQITPASANNPVSVNHTLTGHVNVNPGSGFVNAPAGTTISFSIVSGPGSFVGSVNSCTTVAATGSCTVQIVSSTTGTTVVRASTSVGVGGLTLQRSSGDGKAGDSTDASKNWGDDTARTDILNASGTVVTSVVAGTVVHDEVFVTRTAGTPASVPNPTGTVVFHRYTTGDCSGSSTDQSVALTPGNPSTAITADFAPTAGSMSYKADYLGDANYPARSGACEPLTVTPVPAPAIAIVKNPKGQTVPVGGTAKFQITVTNVGNTVLTNVTVSDPLSPNCDRTSAQIPALASMAPNASVTYSCSRANVLRAFDNVATATGTPPSGPNVTASDSAPVKVKPLPPKKFVPKKHPKVISHKRPKATG